MTVDTVDIKAQRKWQQYAHGKGNSTWNFFVNWRASCIGYAETWICRRHTDSNSLGNCGQWTFTFF